MDNSINGSSFNESDLRLSTSLCQWAGFELDCDDAQHTESSTDHSEDVGRNMNGPNASDGGRLSGEPVSPQCDGEKSDEMLKVVREFLLEKTSQFYNDIIDAQGEKLEKAGMSVERLRKRYETLRSQTANVVGRFRTIGIEEELNNRLKSIDAALRQLSIMKAPVTATLSLSSSDSGRSSTDELGLTNSSPLHQWRQWIEAVEVEMARLRQKIDWTDREALEQRLKSQQALQSQIEQDGGHWVTIVQKYIGSCPSSHRRQIVLASVERRWHALWIKSLEWQCRLERQIRALLTGVTDSNKEDADLGEPLPKRRRMSDAYDTDQSRSDQTSAETTDDHYSDDVCSATSDTIPFSEHEYESLTPRSTLTSNHEEEPLSARDGGYSSGSSAVVTRFDGDNVDDEKPKESDVIDKRHLSSSGSSPCLERRTRIENSPVKCFYKMTPTIPEDPSIQIQKGGQSQEKKKPVSSRLSDDALYVYTQPFVVPPAELTDSLLVNVGDTISETLDNSNNENNVDDLEEIFNLLRQGEERDAFEIELEELLMRRQGTVWVPLSHDDEAENERREQTPTAIVDTPPNTPSLLAPPRMNLPRISSSGSLKRRRREDNRRTVSNSAATTNADSSQTGSERNRLSESAVVCGDHYDDADMSASWSQNTTLPMADKEDPEHGVLLNNSRSGRKKLRACRLRRSWSYGVQFDRSGDSTRRPIPADSLGYCRQSGIISPTRPNTAASITDDENRGALGSTNDVPYGSHQLMEECDGVMTGGGETMAEEELDCDSVIRGNVAVWEWDDYKPPNHNENGPIDQPPLDDSVLTAFGDDYCTYLDPFSTPRTPESGLADESNLSSLTLSTRLPPIGISHDSDGEDSVHVITDSRQELRSIHVALNGRQVEGAEALCGKDFARYMSTCESNIKRLQDAFGSPQSKRKRRISKGKKDSVADLLQDWRDLALLLTRLILESPPQATTCGQTRSSEDEERFMAALRGELQRLEASLKNIVAHDEARSLARGFLHVGNTYKSLEEMEEILEFLKALRHRLTDERKRLDFVLQEYNTSVSFLSAQCDVISEEVDQLRSYFDEAYHNCDSQLRELEMLRQQWSQWLQTEQFCKKLVAKIESATRQDYKATRSNLVLLEERISRLEIAFTKMISSPPHSPAVAACIDQSILSELGDRTESLRRELESIKARISSDDEKSITRVDSGNSEKATRRKRSHSSTTENRDECIEREQPLQPQQRRSTSFRRLLFRSWPIQLCVWLICFSIFLFYPSCCDYINRFWWSWEPKQYYSNGAPPT